MGLRVLRALRLNRGRTWQEKSRRRKNESRMVKKSKKKKWGEEEEKQALQQYHEKLTQKCNEYFIELFDNFDTNAEYSKALTLMQDNERANYKYFKKLFRTKPLIDVDLDGRRVMLRVHFRLIKNSNAQEIKLQHEENIINQEEEERKQEEARQEALKQEQQKQKQRKGGKKQQQVVAVEEKKQERTFDMSFLDQQNLQDIIKTIKFCVEHLAKLVILVPSYDCANGVYRERSSMRFFVDYLQSLLPETIINYNEQGYIIEEFADKMENDFYPENSLLVLENVFFQKEETGRMIDEDRNIETLSYTEKLPFIRTLIEYSPLYVIEDKFNFLNSAVSSIRYVKPESVVLGLGMAEEIKALAYWFQVMKGSTAPFVAVIGGDISLFKLLAIDSLINFCQVIWVTGKIALYLILAKKEENQLFDVVIDGTNIKLKDVVSQIFKKAKEKNVEIKLPEDVQVCEKQENQDIYSIDAQEYINENTKIFKTFGPPQDLINKYQQEQELIRQQEEQEQLLKEQQQKDQKKGGKESKDQKKDTKEKDKQQQEKPQQPEKKRIEIPGWNEIPEDSSIFNILEWGPTTLDSLSQTFSQQFKLLWIDSISPNPRTFPPVFNQSNKLIGSLLMGFQQRQRKLIQQAVSYTHLTLPTKRIVQISVVAVSLKKKRNMRIFVQIQFVYVYR
eukprot:TRINITY_DN7116_c0_g1_i3.p1 TRINITY_DN7116_c0_g1~~TRINITY_DN7116_c0_g1_i3.p1  ORF type:complete len:675 (-),score=134.95 TRINITY_DN7116_c0_g1_i3:47-2071(-)